MLWMDARERERRNDERVINVCMNVVQHGNGWKLIDWTAYKGWWLLKGTKERGKNAANMWKWSSINFHKNQRHHKILLQTISSAHSNALWQGIIGAISLESEAQVSMSNFYSAHYRFSYFQSLARVACMWSIAINAFYIDLSQLFHA